MSFAKPSVKFSCIRILLTLICLLEYNTQVQTNTDPSGPPVWLHGIPPVVKAKHNGEVTGRQHLLDIFVVQAMGRGEGKSVSNLWGEGEGKVNFVKTYF